MIDELPSLRSLFRVLQQVPYLASKNIYRVADHFLNLEHQHIEQFCKTLKEVKNNIIPCSTCFYWQERNGACVLCSSPRRDQRIICVVETWHEVIAIEQTRGYNGVYHVLNGVISPLEGIGPEDLTIEQLKARVTQRSVADSIKEIILTLSQTPEGQATSTYIAQKLRSTEIPITVLACGMPVGTSLHAIDRLTVSKALADRRPL